MFKKNTDPVVLESGFWDFIKMVQGAARKFMVYFADLRISMNITRHERKAPDNDFYNPGPLQYLHVISHFRGNVASFLGSVLAGRSMQNENKVTAMPYIRVGLHQVS